MFILQYRASSHARMTTHPRASTEWREVDRFQNRFSAESAELRFLNRNTYPSGCGVETRIIEKETDDHWMVSRDGTCIDCGFRFSRGDDRRLCDCYVRKEV